MGGWWVVNCRGMLNGNRAKASCSLQHSPDSCGSCVAWVLIPWFFERALHKESWWKLQKMKTGLGPCSLVWPMDPIVSDPRFFNSLHNTWMDGPQDIWASRRLSWSGQCSLPQFAPFRLSESCRCSDLWCAKLLWCLSHWLACPYQDHFVLQYEEPVACSRFPSHIHAPEHIPGWTAAWDHWGSKMNFPAGFAHTRGWSLSWVVAPRVLISDQTTQTYTSHNLSLNQIVSNDHLWGLWRGYQLWLSLRPLRAMQRVGLAIGRPWRCERQPPGEVQLSTNDSSFVRWRKSPGIIAHHSPSQLRPKVAARTLESFDEFLARSYQSNLNPFCSIHHSTLLIMNYHMYKC